MPVDDGSGCDHEGRLLPSSPELAHADPEQLVRRRQSAARPLGVESQELLTKSKVFQNKILAGPEGAEKPAWQVSARDHDENLIEPRPVEPVVKSFICKRTEF